MFKGIVVRVAANDDSIDSPQEDEVRLLITLKRSTVMNWVQWVVIAIVIIVCILFMAFVGKKYLK